VDITNFEIDLDKALKEVQSLRRKRNFLSFALGLSFSLGFFQLLPSLFGSSLSSTSQGIIVFAVALFSTSLYFFLKCVRQGQDIVQKILSHYPLHDLKRD
jgi:hypothetical protein